MGPNRLTKDCKRWDCNSARQIRACGNLWEKRREDHTCKCWRFSTSMISCWAVARMKLVGKSFFFFKGECIPNGCGPSGDNDICARQVWTCHNSRTDQNAQCGPHRYGRNQTRETKNAISIRDRTREVHAERSLAEGCSGHARRQMQEELVLCRCCNRLFPRQPLVLS